ncbi:MAG: HAD family hydrolase [Actinomycetota bacterium]|nr:HAD family hydrolase [Actinomycetota bacterium]
MTRTDPRAGVLFDVDGTLVDTNYLHVLAWWHAFRDAGHDVSMTRIHRSIGMGSGTLVEHLLGAPDERAVTAHTHHYAPYLEQLRPFPRAAEALRAVKALGLEVVLATSASEDEVSSLTEAIDADDAVDEVTSSADAESSKPAPDILQVALERRGLAPERALMVGDTVWDVEAARKAGLECVAVLSGGISRAELEEAGAIAVYDDIAALLDNLEAGPIGRLATSEQAG